ncbi:MAG: IS91 family transposase [Spirochaetes bacterium]|nr:IS91 family transposase [Spirochaetota bacterium]
MSAPIPQVIHQPCQRPEHEVADVFRLYLKDYLKNHKLSVDQYQVVKAILSCRTAILGGHKLKCSHCEHEDQSYNSCGNRHCPKCQGKAKLLWLKKRVEELLPVPYYHVVFTVPHLFNSLFLYNKKICCDILFKASALTLKTFADDPKYLGATLGFLAILHTWGQDLGNHYHTHIMVPGGGVRINENGDESWINAPKGDQFLFPVLAMSKVFRGIFITLLKKAYYCNQLQIPDCLEELSDHRMFEGFLDQAVSRKWNVYAKKPFAGPEQVLLYIGRYTHRIAVSNHRLKSIDNGEVAFEYLNYKDKEDPKKIMHLKADEFIRRFLCHTVPKGYHRIHMYGFLANGKRIENLIKIRSLINSRETVLELNEAFIESFFTLFSKPKTVSCPVCEKGVLQEGSILPELEIKDLYPYLFKKRAPG